MKFGGAWEPMYYNNIRDLSIEHIFINMIVL